MRRYNGGVFGASRHNIQLIYGFLDVPPARKKERAPGAGIVPAPVAQRS
jgi:hypothetical protein